MCVDSVGLLDFKSWRSLLGRMASPGNESVSGLGIRSLSTGVHELKAPAVGVPEVYVGAAGRGYQVRRPGKVHASGLELPMSSGHVGHLEGDVVHAGVLLTGHSMDLEDRLILARELELHGVAVVLGALQLLESEGPEHGHVVLEVLDDDLDVVDLRDHVRSLSF